jgi:hypothetical protein
MEVYNILLYLKDLMEVYNILLYLKDLMEVYNILLYLKDLMEVYNILLNCFCIKYHVWIITTKIICIKRNR